MSSIPQYNSSSSKTSLQPTQLKLVVQFLILTNHNGLIQMYQIMVNNSHHTLHTPPILLMVHKLPNNNNMNLQFLLEPRFHLQLVNLVLTILVDQLLQKRIAPRCQRPHKQQLRLISFCLWWIFSWCWFWFEFKECRFFFS